jgi:hypothetical protein
VLSEHCGVRNKGDLPSLTVKQILKWADEHHKRTGKWPKQNSGLVQVALGETWTGIHGALSRGLRGLPGGSSLAKLLTEHRGMRNKQDLPTITINKILKWADEHHKRTSKWPIVKSGPIQIAKGETWLGVNSALIAGGRGLNSGSSLAKLLSERRGVRNHLDLPPLTTNKILEWADEHHKRTGQFPMSNSGPIKVAAGETWLGIDSALQQGGRGFPSGRSLAKLLSEHRGVRNKGNLPTLTIQQILKWANERNQRTGNWPNRNSGAVQSAAGETWCGIDSALHVGRRGLLGGSSLSKILSEYRDVRRK